VLAHRRGHCFAIIKRRLQFANCQAVGKTAGVTSHLVGVSEIAEMLGVSRQRVDQISKSDPHFPQPEAVLKGGKVWARKAIDRWLASRRRGRP
jgi:predicted DNA-binding transcriptional regulator AlpA